jgi:uracil-DNA glycosylase family 4
VKEKNGGCVECPLKGKLRLLPIISDETPGEPRTLFVGEAPTEDEIRAGKLTEGRDTGLFRNMIDRFNVKNFAVTNACLCFPGIGKKPKVKDLENCAIWLETFIADFNPDRIVCLGKFAARAILGKEIAKKKMYTLREQSPLKIVDTNEGFENITDVFVTYSPKAIFKRPKLIDDFVSDLDFVFNPPEDIWVDPEILYLNGTPKEIIGNATDGKLEQFFINHHLGNYQNQEPDMVGPIALDFETTGRSSFLYQ